MPTAQRIAFLRGHQDAVVCLSVTQDSQLVASGAEDGGLCVHDVATSQLLCRLQCALDDETAVGAVAWHPKPLPVHTLTQQPGSSSSNSSSSSSSANNGACGSGRLLFAGVGQELLVLLLLPADGGSSSSSSSAGSNGDSHAQVQQAAESTAAAGRGVASAAGAAPVDSRTLQLVVVLRQVVSHDDISALAVNTPGTHLAVADDTGDVVLFDIQKLQQQLQALHAQPQQQQQQQQQSLQPCRTIAGAHDPMATAVGFRGPHKPWQLLSGGVDSRVALWDFSRPKKCCGSWNMQHMAGQLPTVNPAAVTAADTSAAAAAAAAAAGVKGSSRSGNGGMESGGTTQQEGQLWNPPMVHSLALPWTLPQQQQQQQKPAVQPTAAAAGSGGDSVPAVPAAVLKRLVAAARGDGVIAVFDADPDAKPLAPQHQHQQQQQQQQPPSRKVGGKGSKGGRSRGRTGSVQQDGPGSSSSSSSNASGNVPQQEQQQEQQQQQQLSEVPGGFHVCLGASMGGHTLPAAAVAFLPWGGGGRYLCSGGQDGKLLLWDWPAAFAAAHTDEHRAQTGEGTTARGTAAGGISAEHTATEDAAAAVTAAGAAAAGPLSADTHKADSSAAAAVKPSSSSTSNNSTPADANVPGVQQRSRCLPLSVNHKRKVNAMCCCWAPQGPTAPVQANGASAAAASVGQRGRAPVLLLVADTASRISVYRLRL